MQGKELSFCVMMLNINYCLCGLNGRAVTIYNTPVGGSDIYTTRARVLHIDAEGQERQWFSLIKILKYS